MKMASKEVAVIQVKHGGLHVGNFKSDNSYLLETLNSLFGSFQQFTEALKPYSNGVKAEYKDFEGIIITFIIKDN